MRIYANTLLMESALDSIGTGNDRLWELSDTVMAPVVSITEEDCGTLLGENVVADYDAEGLLEVSTGLPLTRARINSLRAAGRGRVDTRGLRSCIAPAGLCRTCLGANRPLLDPVPPVGSRVKILPETFLQIAQANLPPGQTDIPLDFSPEQYDFLYLYETGGLVPATEYTISGKTLSMAAIPGFVASTLLLHFDGNFLDATGNTTFEIGYTGGLPHSSIPTFTSSFSPAFGQRTVVTGESSGAPGTSSVNLSIGTSPFTLEGRSRFTTGATGGILLSKSFYPNSTASDLGGGIEWSLEVRSSFIRFSIAADGILSLTAGFSEILDQDFAWAVTDDGTTLRVYVDGVLINTASTFVGDVFNPPVTTLAQVSLFNALQGYAGSTPDWGTSGYKGIIDELAFTRGTAKYTGVSYSLAATPFPPLSSDIFVPPTLLLHLDDTIADATGNTVFNSSPGGTVFPPCLSSFTDSFAPAFNRRAITSTQVNSTGAVGVSGIELAIGTMPFTLEGRSRFTTGVTGGILLSKNYFPNEGASFSGVGLEWAISVYSNSVQFEWRGDVGNTITSVAFPAILDQDFAWAATDDGAAFRVYINGVLVGSSSSAISAAFPPRIGPAQLALFNGLQGYSGVNPNWSPSGYNGLIDELAFTRGVAKYTGGSYSLKDAPFSLTAPPGPSGRDFTIKYVVISRVTFYYWLAATFSGAMLGIKPLPTRPLILKKQLLLENIPESLVDEIASDLEDRGEVTGDFTEYLKTIKDPLEKALFAILLGSIFLNA